MLHVHAALKVGENHRKTGAKRWGGMVGDALRKVANKQAPPGTPMADFTPETEVTKEVCFLFCGLVLHYAVQQPAGCVSHFVALDYHSGTAGFIPRW